MSLKENKSKDHFSVEKKPLAYF